MRILRALLLLLALGSPALAHDGAGDAAAARDAAQAFQRYVEGIAKTGGRPDLTRPEVAKLLRQVFDLDALAALPPAQASDIPWLLDWVDAADRTSKMIMTYGAKPGPKPDWTAITRNFAEYEDQYAAAVNFLIRFQAREAVAAELFMAGLAPEKRAPVREAVTDMRTSFAEVVRGTIVWAQGAKPANARLVAAAIADTRDVSASFILPKSREQLIGLLARSAKTVPDEEARKHLAAFAAALKAVN